MKQSLARIFNQTAAAAYEAFPEQLQRLTVLLVPDADTPVYVSPQIAERLTQNIAGVKYAVKNIENYMSDHRALGVANRHYPMAGTVVNLIALDQRHTPSVISRRCTKEMQAVYVLDHEIGHHIVRNGFSLNDHTAESAADAFAMLRHIQRYGKGTRFAKNYGATRARCIVLFSGMEHYTATATSAAIKIANDMGEDFFALSLHETAKLAAEVACDNQLHSKTLLKIRNAYWPVAEYCKTLGQSVDTIEKLQAKDQATITGLWRETLAVMREYQDDPDIVGAGKLFLDSPEIKTFMANRDKAPRQKRHGAARIVEP